MNTAMNTKMWRIMPFYRSKDETEWWIICGQDNKVIGCEPIEQQAFDKALAHNVRINVPGVYIHGACMKGGEWKHAFDPAKRVRYFGRVGEISKADWVFEGVLEYAFMFGWIAMVVAVVVLIIYKALSGN